MARRDAEPLDPDVARLQAMLAALRAQPSGRASLETILTHPDYFGLTSASPLQRAICRLIEGAPFGGLEADASVLAAFGCDVPARLPCPRELALVAGIRGGKSLLAAAIGVRCSQAVDCSSLGPGEVPRFSVVSLSRDLAEVIYGHLVGRVRASPVLSGLLLEEPSGDSVLLRHPSGRPIELSVVAGSRAGGSLTARWMAGAVFDEFPRMVGAESGVVNWDDSRKAVIERILPGGLVAHIGSAWAPFGPAFDLVTSDWGRPSENLVVIKAPAYAMNPEFWTDERRQAARERDPDVYQTDVESNFATPAESMYSSVNLDRCTRAMPLEIPPADGQECVAAIDPATRSNGWTLVIATRVGSKRIVVLAREWRGSHVDPLDPEEVLQEIGALLTPYRVKALKTDQWAADPLRALARRYGVNLQAYGSSQDEQIERYKAFGTRLEVGEIELPPERQLLADLRRVGKQVTSRSIRIALPKTSDGRHCDYAPAIMLALASYLGDPPPPPPSDGSKEAFEREAKKMMQAASERFGRGAKHRR